MNGYSIGRPKDPRDDDPRYSAFEEACTAATTLAGEANKFYADDVLAVWHDDTGEILALVLHGVVYRP